MRLARDRRFCVGIQDASSKDPITAQNRVTIFPSFGFRADPQESGFVRSLAHHISIFAPEVFIPIGDAFILARDGLDKLGYGKTMQLMPYIPIDSNVVPSSSDLILNNAQKILVQSRFGKEELELAGYDNVHVLRHGVNFEEMYVDEETRMQSRLEFGIDDDVIVFLFVGRNSRRKRMDRLIRAYADSVKGNSGHKTKLILHGSDYNEPIYDIYKRIAFEEKRLDVDLSDNILIPHKVHKLGFGVDFDEIKKLYAACDWTVSASSGEGTGLLSLESFCAGRPTIYPENSNYLEILGDSRSLDDKPHFIRERGLSVKSPFLDFTGMMTEQWICDINELSSVISEACNIYKNDQLLYRDMVENARKWVLENSDWINLVEELKHHIFDIFESS